MNATTLNQSDCPEVKVSIHLFFTIGAVSLVENLLVVVAVIWNRNLHSPMYCFICSLAAFNTVASITKAWENVMIVIADEGHLEKSGSPVKNLDDVVDSLLCMAFVGSIFSFLAIAVDRYVTVFHALRYHNIMTMQRTGAILGMIWTMCGVFAVVMVRFFDTYVIMISFVVFFIVSLVVICLLYGNMFMLARIHARTISALPISGGGRRRHQQGVRGVLTLTILVGSFLVCWSPFFVHLFIIMVCPMNPYCECYRSLFHLHVLLLMSHALIDPAIYAFRIPELQRTFRKLLLCLVWRQ